MVCLSSKPCFGTLQLFLGYLAKLQEDRDFQKRRKKKRNRRGKEEEKFSNKYSEFSTSVQSAVLFSAYIIHYENKINFHNDGTEL